MQDYDTNDAFEKTSENLTVVPDSIPVHVKVRIVEFEGAIEPHLTLFFRCVQSVSLINCRIRELSSLAHLTSLEQLSLRKNLIPTIQVRVSWLFAFFWLFRIFR